MNLSKKMLAILLSLLVTKSIFAINIQSQLGVCFCNRSERVVAVHGNFVWLPGQGKWLFTKNALGAHHCITQVLWNNNDFLNLLYLKIGHASLNDQIYDGDVSFNYFTGNGFFGIIVEPGLSRGCYTNSFSILSPRNYQRF